MVTKSNFNRAKLEGTLDLFGGYNLREKQYNNLNEKR